MAGTGQRLLLIYAVVLTCVVTVMLLAGAAAPKTSDFDEITVHRINVVEPDGTLRMVISNHARLPGIIVRGKEQPFDRPQAGMIFYNDEGSENGGLIFGGHRNPKGEVVDSGVACRSTSMTQTRLCRWWGSTITKISLPALVSATACRAGRTTGASGWVGVTTDRR